MTPYLDTVQFSFLLSINLFPYMSLAKGGGGLSDDPSFIQLRSTFFLFLFNHSPAGLYPGGVHFSFLLSILLLLNGAPSEVVLMTVLLFSWGPLFVSFIYRFISL